MEFNRSERNLESIRLIRLLIFFLFMEPALK